MLTRVQLEVALQKKKKHKNKNKKKKTNNGKERGNHAYWGRNSWHVASRTLVPQLLGANLRYLAKENHLPLRVLDRYLLTGIRPLPAPPANRTSQECRTEKDLMKKTR